MQESSYDQLQEIDSDTVAITNSTFYNLIARLGGGADSFSASGVGVDYLLHVNTERGADSISVTNSILNDVEFFSGTGSDEIYFNNNLRASDVNIFTGGGADTVQIDGNTRINRLELDTGNQDDTVFITNNEQIDMLFADLGRGNDSLVLDNNSVYPVSIDGGDGTDTLFSRNNRWLGYWANFYNFE